MTKSDLLDWPEGVPNRRELWNMDDDWVVERQVPGIAKLGERRRSESLRHRADSVRSVDVNVDVGVEVGGAVGKLPGQSAAGDDTDNDARAPILLAERDHLPLQVLADRCERVRNDWIIAWW